VTGVREACAQIATHSARTEYGELHSGCTTNPVKKCGE